MNGPSNPRRCVVVTGAAGALGRSVVQRFVADGAEVALLDHQLAALEALFPDAPLKLAADITDEANVRGAIAHVLQRFGRIDVLVHVAGGFEMGEPVHGLTRASWDRMMNLNAWAFVCLAHAVAPSMQAQRSGKIIAVSAGAASAGQAFKGAYIASKSALQRLVEALSHELRPHGIQVNSVAPTTMDTPANRAAMPDVDRSAWVATEQAAAAIAFLASRDGDAVHGQHLLLGA
jgi:NAD(P)-dependent dehydrogenase (short-subunit alcohol dehydrogenase family)